MFLSLETKLIAGALGFAIIAGIGACGMRKWDAAEITKLEAAVADRDATLTLLKVTQKAKADEQAAKVRAAEARVGVIEKETAALIKAAMATRPKPTPATPPAGPPVMVVAPGPAPTPTVEGGTVACEDVLKWEREQYAAFCARWQPRPQ